jgi:hypothetical protein
LVEYPIDQFRPDIVLKRNEETIGAVEVFVTHSIEPQKEEYLQNLSIPWVEVDASSVLENEWTSEQPLPYRKINPATVSTWYCATCSAAEKRAEIEKQYKKTAVRIVDFFYPNKKHFRSIFYARKRVQDSRITKIEIIENTEKVICSISEPTFPQDNQKLNHLFDQYIKKFKDRGYIVDDHMKWQPYDNEIFKQNIFARNTLKLLPRRYYWLQNKWVAVSAFQELNWNVRFTDKNQYEKQLSVLIQTLRRNKAKAIRKKTIILPSNPLEKMSFQSTDEIEETSSLPELERCSCHSNNNEIERTTSLPKLECCACHIITDEYWYSRAGKCLCNKCAEKGINPNFYYDK